MLKIHQFKKPSILNNHHKHLNLTKNIILRTYEKTNKGQIKKQPVSTTVTVCKSCIFMYTSLDFTKYVAYNNTNKIFRIQSNFFSCTNKKAYAKCEAFKNLCAR